MLPKSNIHSPIRQPLNTADAIRKDSFPKKSIKKISCPDSRVLKVKDGRAWPLWRHVVYKEMGTLKTRQVLRTTGSKGTTCRRSILGRLRYKNTSCNTGKGSSRVPSSNSRIRHPQVIHQSSVLLTCGIRGNGTNIRWHLRTVRPTGGRIRHH